MNTNYVSIIPAIVLFFVLSVSVSAAPADLENRPVRSQSAPESAGTITVTNTNDSGAGSLRQAIADAAPGETITFNVTGTITLTSGELVIDKNLTIQGPGASVLSISGNQTSKVFSVNSGVTVTLDGITIRDGGGNFNDAGGGIYNAGSLTVSNSIISGNTAGLFCGHGGGILNHFGTLAISNSTIADNRSLNFEQCGEGGGIANYYGTVTITDSTISGNQESGEGAGGGGILNYVGDSTMSIVNSTISGNMSVNVGGGGISNSGTLTVIGSTVSNNSGGGILNYGTLTVSNCTVSSNTPAWWDYPAGGINNSNYGDETFVVNNSTITGNDVGIYSASGQILRNTIVAGNTGGDIVLHNVALAAASHNLIGDAASSGGIVNGVNGNIVGVNALLGPLQNNGGPMLTHALLPGSPAINAGNNCVLTENGCGDGNPALTTDQRGVPRIGIVDIGAFEFLAPTAAGVSVAGRVLTVEGRGVVRAVITLTDASGTARTVLTSAIGYYRFDNVESGDTYLLSVDAKHYTFSEAVRLITVDEDLADVSFTAEPRRRGKSDGPK